MYPIVERSPFISTEGMTIGAVPALHHESRAGACMLLTSMETGPWMAGSQATAYVLCENGVEETKCTAYGTPYTLDRLLLFLFFKLWHPNCLTPTHTQRDTDTDMFSFEPPHIFHA